MLSHYFVCLFVCLFVCFAALAVSASKGRGGAGIVHRKVFGVADNKGGAGGRGGLLSDIRSGKNLKKVEKEKAMKVGCEEGWGVWK